MDRPENWTERNLMKLSKGKCRILHLRRNNLRHQLMLEADQQESSSAEKDLEVLVDNKMTMSKQWTLMAKKPNSVLGCMRSVTRRLRGDPFLLSTGEVASEVATLSTFGLPSTRDMDVLEHLSCESVLGELGLVSLDKRRLRGVLSMCIDT